MSQTLAESSSAAVGASPSDRRGSLDRRPTTARRRAGRAMLACLLSVCVGCGGGAQSEGDCRDSSAPASRLPVTVSVAPQAWLAESVGGERVAISILVPPGSAPETFEPAPRQMAALVRARVVVAVGHPAFPFEDRFLHSLGGATMEGGAVRVVRMVGEGGASPGSSAAETAGDPHVWLSPPAMARTAHELARVLGEVQPEGAAGYETRLEATLREIDRVESETRRLLAGTDRRRFFVAHPAWGSFASHFGLEQVAIEEEGKEPSPSRLASLVREARAEGVRTLFVQRGVATRSAELLADEVGARLVELDPLARDWPEAMLTTARALAGR